MKEDGEKNLLKLHKIEKMYKQDDVHLCLLRKKKEAGSRIRKEFFVAEKRKRSCSVLIRLTQEELDKLDEKVARSGLPREVYIRAVLADSKVYAPPPLEYHELKNEIRRIGVNLNRITMVANATGNIYHKEYKKAYDELLQYLLLIDDKLQSASRPVSK